MESTHGTADLRWRYPPRGEKKKKKCSEAVRANGAFPFNLKLVLCSNYWCLCLIFPPHLHFLLWKVNTASIVLSTGWNRFFFKDNLNVFKYIYIYMLYAHKFHFVTTNIEPWGQSVNVLFHMQTDETNLHIWQLIKIKYTLYFSGSFSSVSHIQHSYIQ